MFWLNGLYFNFEKTIIFNHPILNLEIWFQMINIWVKTLELNLNLRHNFIFKAQANEPRLGIGISIVNKLIREKVKSVTELKK